MIFKNSMKRDGKRYATKFETLSLILFIFTIFFVGSKLEMNYVPLIAFVAAYACFLAWKCGYSWKEIEKAVSKKIGGATSIFTIFLAVGALIGSLIYCGTVPMLIYYGTKFFSAKWLYLCAFLICGIFSVLTGTSHGSIGTAGVAMISLGQVMPSTNLPMLAGAIVCGSILGDKISPFSDTTLVAAAVTGNDVYDHVAHQAKTVIPAACISIIIYFIIGLVSKSVIVINNQETVALQESLDLIYHWNVLLILPAIVIIWGSVTRRPTLITIIVSTTIAILIGIFVQGFSISSGIRSLYDGFNITMVPNIDTANLSTAAVTVCNRGGMTSFVKTFFTAFISFYFAAAAELAGTLQNILSLLNKYIKNTFSLVLSTGVAMVIMNCLCGSSTPSASVIGPLFKPKYEEMGLHSLNLAREIEDFGTGSTAFIPWSASGALYVGILGVNSSQYFKYSFFIWIVWIIALFYSATGICMMKLEDNKRCQKFSQ